MDSKLGRPQALTIEDEATLVRYITYMAQRRHPVTREQIIGLAWAIELRNGSKCFPETGPTFKWWRGFRDRHRHEIALRKPESVDHGRVANTLERCFKLTRAPVGERQKTLKHVSVACRQLRDMYIEIVMLNVLNVRVNIMRCCVDQSETVSQIVIISLLLAIVCVHVTSQLSRSAITEYAVRVATQQ